MNKKSKKNIEVEFCKKCVMSNQKVLPSVLIEDNTDHTNKDRLGFKDGVCDACIEVEKNIMVVLTGIKDSLILENC